MLGFSVFNNPDYLTHHYITDDATHEHTLEHLQFHFIELTKFNKSLNELITSADKWAFLLKNADDLSFIPRELKDPYEVEEALEVLEQGLWEEAELLSL